MGTVKKLSLSDLRYYCDMGRQGLVQVNDLRNRRAFPLAWTGYIIEEKAVSCLVCTSHKHGELTDENAATYQNAFYYKVFGCLTPGFNNLVRIEIWGGFSLTTLFNAGDALFYLRKPCRTYLVTAPQWEQMKKHMGEYDAITAKHEAFWFEKLAYEGGQAYTDQKSVIIPDGYKWKL